MAAPLGGRPRPAAAPRCGPLDRRRRARGAVTARGRAPGGGRAGAGRPPPHQRRRRPRSWWPTSPRSARPGRRPGERRVPGARDRAHRAGRAPSAALVDDRERGEWIPRAAHRRRDRRRARRRPPRRRTPPASTGARPTTRRCSATRRAPPARPRARCSTTPTCSRPRGARAGLALDPDDGSCSPSRCSTCTGSASVCTARCWPGVGRAAAAFDPDAVLDASRPSRHPLLRRADDVRPLGRSARFASWARAALRVGVGAAAAGLHRGMAVEGGRVLERYGHDRDADERVEPLRRRAPPRHRRLPAAGGGDPPGDGDEILVRGPNVFGGYWGRPGDASVLHADGWFRTGDIGASTPTAT